MAIKAFLRNVTIRTKLSLLAGIPVLGSLLLALQIVRDAQIQVQKNKTLGTIEHVAQLSEVMGTLVNELQVERALAARIQGQNAPASAGPDNELDAIANPNRHDPEIGATQDAFHKQISLTQAAARRLAGLVDQQEIKKLPQRLAVDVQQATTSLIGLNALRTQITQEILPLAKVTEQYQKPIRSLIEGIAAVSELTDNGELLRLITSLVSVLELKERGSQEHALLAYVFEAERFPPGSYRSFVTLVTEERVYLDSFKTTAASEQLHLYETTMTRDVNDRAAKLRSVALENTDERVVANPEEWFRAQRARLAQLGSVERVLHARVGEVAMKRIDETRRAEWGSALLVGAVILVSVLLAWVVARGVTRRVTTLRDVALQVGQGNLSMRVHVNSKDELGTLGQAFNHMISEIAQARQALGTQIRMARELEIAASLQQALLPPVPAHPDFEFVGRMRPADEVGGDFYDVLRDSVESHLWITIGDVSGHGLDAGLVMLMTQSAFASQFRASALASPSAAIRNVNQLLCENIAERLKDRKYVTAQVFTYRGAGQFLCAGAHQPTIVYRAKQRKCEILEIPGPWLGIDPTIVDIPVVPIVLEPDDILCLYTDGLPEARNQEGELFDIPRFSGVITDSAREHPDLDAIADAIIQRVEQHVYTQEDDWTLLLVRRRADAAVVS
jgi:serine phosphatase RsbU (regulator of sigma subunit)